MVNKNEITNQTIFDNNSKGDFYFYIKTVNKNEAINQTRFYIKSKQDFYFQFITR